MIFVCNTSSCGDYHLCHIIGFNPNMHDKGMGKTQSGFTEIYEQSLSANCDLDF